jgi:hypothetical protein
MDDACLGIRKLKHHDAFYRATDPSIVLHDRHDPPHYVRLGRHHQWLQLTLHHLSLRPDKLHSRRGGYFELLPRLHHIL